MFCRVGRNLCRSIQTRGFAKKSSSSSEPPSTAGEYASSAENDSDLSESHSEKNANFTEVEIPVPWGHIAGKWWGSLEETPVLALHGFEDNAGSYDRLAPLLGVPLLAWDAPGHGRSSHMPIGYTYHFIDFVIALRLLVRRHGWEKVSFIGHSWGSATALIYSALFPNCVERFVSIDCARSIMPNVGVLGIDRLRTIVNHMIKCDNLDGRTPPQYQIRDARNLIVQGTFESVLPENCDPLLLRGTKPHPDNPDAVYFSRDYRLRGGDICRPTNELVTEACRKIRCHMLSICARQGFITVVGGTVEKHFHEQESIISKGAASFQSHLVKGSHHVHLNNPERIAPMISAFLQQA